MADILMMTIAFSSCWFGYWLAEENPLEFDTLEGHALLNLIVSFGCACAAMGLYVLCL